MKALEYGGLEEEEEEVEMEEEERMEEDYELPNRRRIRPPP